MRSYFVPPLVVGAVSVLLTVPAQASTLVADWEMNETTGTTMIDSSGHNNGTLHNIKLNGSYYSFNGTDSLATATEQFAIGTANISFTARIRFASLPSKSVGDYDIVRGAPAGNWKLEIVRRNQGTTAKANCHFAGSLGGTQLAAGPSLADGQWHVITCAKTAKTISVTVDGTTYTKSAAIGTINTTGKEIALGGQTTGQDEYKGDIDYVRVQVG